MGKNVNLNQHEDQLRLWMAEYSTEPWDAATLADKAFEYFETSLGLSPSHMPELIVLAEQYATVI